MNERVTKLETFAEEALRRFDRLERAVERIQQELTDFRLEMKQALAEMRIGSKEEIHESYSSLKSELHESHSSLKNEHHESYLSLKQEMHEHRLATKRDIDNAIKWIVGVMIAISMAAITIITFVLNYATPKAAPPSQQPIVIYATAPPVAQAAVPSPKVNP